MKRRRVGGCPVFVLEPVGEACHSVLPLSWLGPNGSTSEAAMASEAEVKPRESLRAAICAVRLRFRSPAGTVVS
jgi:hypothetical protein